MFIPNSIKGKLFYKYLKMPAHPSKIRLQNIAGRKLFPKGIFLNNKNNVSFILDANDWITRIMLIEGDYEPGSTRLAKEIMADGGLFIDVGANFGLFTCIVANSNKKVRVIAIEPNFKIIPLLLANIRINALAERVQVINIAISDKFQLVTIDQPVADNIGTTVTNAGCRGLLSILSCSLKYIIEENSLSVVELIKIDIEGNEFEVLKSVPFEQVTIKNIILEFNHLSKISFHELTTFFKSKGFRISNIKGEELVNEKVPIPENNIWLKNQNI